MTKKRIVVIKKIFLNLFFISLCFCVLIPIMYTVAISFSGNNSLINPSPVFFIPVDFTFENYYSVFVDEPILTWFGNTILLAISTVVLSLTISIPCAYAFSRLKFKFKNSIFKTLILLNAFPSILSMMAMFLLLNALNLMNSKLGLILIYTGTMTIFGIMNLKGYFDTIPYDIESAARIDGCSELQVVMKIVIPLAKPSIIVTAMMVLIYVWNEYIFSVTFLTGAQNFTLAAGLYSLQAGEMSGNWPIFAAASIIVTIPILVAFLLVQRHMISGLSVGGVKG